MYAADLSTSTLVSSPSRRPLEPVQSARWPGRFCEGRAHHAERDDMTDIRRTERVADDEAHRRSVLGEARIGHVLGEQDERRDGAREEPYEVIHTRRVSHDDLGAALLEVRQVTSVLQHSNLFTRFQQCLGHLAADVPCRTHHDDHVEAPSLGRRTDAIGTPSTELVRIGELVRVSNLWHAQGMTARDEYCPLTRSLDLFGDRWGLLVVRELLRGVSRFNELERSLPGISRSTLAQRLRHLEKESIVERRTMGDGGRSEYQLTKAGRDLTKVLDAMGEWGVRWLVPHRRPSEIDPDGLMQWIRRHVVLRELPARRVVIRFELAGRSRRYFWLIMQAGEASLCPEDPGFEEDVFVSAHPIDLYRLVAGQQSLARAMDEGTVRVDGPPALVRSLPRWLFLRASGPPITAGSPPA